MCTDEHMATDMDGFTNGCVHVHRGGCIEHFARIAHVSVEIVGITIHNDAVATDVHVVIDGDFALCPQAS